MNKIIFFGMVCIVTGLAGELNAAPWHLDCPEKIKKLPRLVAGDGVLEPSGVVWDPITKMALAVSDEASPYALFAFDPNQIGADKDGPTIQAMPLLTPSQEKTYRPKDMEAISRFSDGTFIAAASLSLVKDKARDTVLRFALKQDKTAHSAWHADEIQTIPSNGKGLRSWLIEAAHPPWEDTINRQEGESGINVEGMAIAEHNDQLYLGFRSPNHQGKIPVLAMHLDAKGDPMVVKWHTLELGKGFDEGGVLGIGKEPIGIRDMTPTSDSEGNAFLLLLGASGSGSDIPFQVGWWRDGEKKITWVGKVPKGFRAEGLTILPSNAGTLSLLMVSDKHGMVMRCQATRKK